MSKFPDMGCVNVRVAGAHGSLKTPHVVSPRGHEAESCRGWQVSVIAFLTLGMGTATMTHRIVEHSSISTGCLPQYPQAKTKQFHRLSMQQEGFRCRGPLATNLAKVCSLRPGACARPFPQMKRDLVTQVSFL